MTNLWTNLQYIRKCIFKWNTNQILRNFALDWSPKLYWICIHFSWRGSSSFRLYTLGPLFLWQCFYNDGIEMFFSKAPLPSMVFQWFCDGAMVRWLASASTNAFSFFFINFINGPWSSLDQILQWLQGRLLRPLEVLPIESLFVVHASIYLCQKQWKDW